MIDILSTETEYHCEECGKALTNVTLKECWYCGGNFCKDHINEHDCE